MPGRQQLVEVGPREGHGLHHAEVERPLGLLVRQPAYLSAVWYAVVAYAVMGFIMTATPIGMHVMDGYDLKDTKLVIQAHMIAMYLPSLLSGFFVSRFGAGKLAALG